MAKVLKNKKNRLATVSGLTEKIKSRQAKICIIGLGYTGLPLAVEFAKEKFSVTGIDVNADRVNGVKSGQSYLEDVDDAVIRSLVRAKKLAATDDFSSIKSQDVILICVPTPLTPAREPDMSYIISAAKSVAKFLKKDQLIILQSTTYPGTTEEVVLPILEKTGLEAGKNFYLAYSPERVDPGNAKYTIKNTPKIVSGLTSVCLEQAKLLFEQIVDTVIPVSSLRTVELVKLFENIFRNVNIALVNELALLCDRMGIDVWEVIDAAATKPFGFMRFLPGPGLGGHCIPVDPFYLSWKAREYNFYTEFIELAGKINENMPYYVVAKITEALNEHKKSISGSKILLIGAAYKKNISDVRGTPMFKILSLLKSKGAQISYHDPYVLSFILGEEVYFSEALSKDILKKSDCVVIITDHSNINYELIAKEAPLIVDTRNVFEKLKDESSKIKTTKAKDQNKEKAQRVFHL